MNCVFITVNVPSYKILLVYGGRGKSDTRLIKILEKEWFLSEEKQGNPHAKIIVNQLQAWHRNRRVTYYCLNSFFWNFLGHSLRLALFVYRLIGIFLMIPSEIKIKIFAKCAIYGMLGSKGLTGEDSAGMFFSEQVCKTLHLLRQKMF